MRSGGAELDKAPVFSDHFVKRALRGFVYVIMFMQISWDL